MFMYEQEDIHENNSYFVHVYVCVGANGAPSTTENPPLSSNKSVYSFNQVAGNTGWGAQSWTVFCGPAAVAIGGCERKD